MAFTAVVPRSMLPRSTQFVTRISCGPGDRNKLDIVQTDVVDDPTLQRSKNAICEKCNYNEAVFFQADEVRSFPQHWLNDDVETLGNIIPYVCQ